MKQKRIIFCVLAFIFLFGCSGVNNTTPAEPVNPHDSDKKIQTLEFNVYAGKVFWKEVEGVNEYYVFVNDVRIGQVTEFSFNVIDAISDAFGDLTVGDWTIKVSGLNQDGTVVATNSEKMRVMALNESNFTTVLNGEYKASDYFLLEEDIYYFGGDNPNLEFETPYGYTYKEVVYYGEGIKCFIKKPFSATLDGNGHTINLLIDRPLTGNNMAVGALFVSLTETGMLKNLVVNGDYTRTKLSQYTAFAVYKDCAGRIENCWFNFTLRPTDTGNRYQFDPQAALIGCTKDGFYAKNAVFLLKVLDDNGQEILVAPDNQKTGGAVCRSEGTSVYDNCVFIQRGGMGRFINDNSAHAKAGLGSSIANSVFYYSAVEDFISGENGLVFTGDFKNAGYNLTFSEPASNKAYLNWDNVWSIDENSIYLKGAELYFD